MTSLEALNAWNPLPECATTHEFGVDVLRLGFVACSSDCYSASITDAILGLHCAMWVHRIRRAVGGTGKMRSAFLGTLVSNMVWSLSGVLVWLQPGGSRGPPFWSLFRLNGIAQSILVFHWWAIVAAMLGGLASTPRVLPELIRTAGAVHSLLFCLRNLESSLEAYVLCGGAHVTQPLCCIWLLLIMLCRQHSLFTRWVHRGIGGAPRRQPHPLLLGVFCGIIIWFGVSGLLMGRDAGLVYWSHSALQWLCHTVGLLPPGAPLWPGAFDEMTCFHVYGLLGNELLFRAYAWLAATEAKVMLEASAVSCESEMAPEDRVPQHSSTANCEAASGCANGGYANQGPSIKGAVCNGFAATSRARRHSVGPWLTLALHGDSPVAGRKMK